MASEKRLADLIFDTTRNMTQTELNKFRRELTKALPVVVEKAAKAAKIDNRDGKENDK